MFVLTFAMLVAIFFYGLLYSPALLLIFATSIGLYVALERYFKKKGTTMFRRKIQIATWSESGDPTSWSKLEVNLTKTDEFIKEYNAQHPDDRITLTVIALKSLGYAMASAGKSWGKLSFGNFIPSQSVDVTVLVNVEGDNVINALVKNCDKAGIESINAQFKPSIKKIKRKEDKDINFQFKLVKMLPTFIVKIFLTISSFVVYELGLPFNILKMKKNHFGNAILTNVTSFNLVDVYASHVPFTKGMLVCMLNTPELRPTVVDNQVVARKMMNINFLFDMRFIELKELADILKTIKNVFEDPKEYIK